MPLAPSVNGTHNRPAFASGRYGLADRFDFDNPEKWTTVKNVPVLDEHELEAEGNQPPVRVDRGTLSEIASNNNKRVIESGDPAPLIVGHTSEDPTAPERKVVGYAVNYKVLPFKRAQDGRTIYAVHTDYKVRKKHEHVIEDFPRRSVELWLSRKELDPIALLGGTTPERDLGVIIRKSRFAQMTFDRYGSGSSIHAQRRQPTGPTIHYSKQTGTLLRYELSDDTEGETPSRFNMAGANGKMSPGKGKKVPAMPKVSGGAKPTKMAAHEEDDEQACNYSAEQYAADGVDSHPDEPEEDLEGTNLPGGGGGEDDGSMGEDPAATDPGIAKIFQSRSFQSMLEKAIVTAVQGMLAAEEQGGAGPGGPGAGAGAPPMGGAAGGEQMAGADGLAPPQGGAPDAEAREMHEPPPVKFGATGFAGPTSGFVPGVEGTGTMGKRYAQNGQPMSHSQQPSKMSRREPMPTTQQRPRQQQPNPDVVRLSRIAQQQGRELAEMREKLSRAEAEQRVAALQQEGIEFADPAAEVELQVTITDPEALQYHIEEVVKKNYARRTQQDPATGSTFGLSRFARHQEGTQVGDSVTDENYDPQTPEEATMIGDTVAKLSHTNGKPAGYGDAIKYLREKGKLKMPRR